MSFRGILRPMARGWLSGLKTLDEGPFLDSQWLMNWIVLLKEFMEATLNSKTDKNPNVISLSLATQCYEAVANIKCHVFST